MDEKAMTNGVLTPDITNSNTTEEYQAEATGEPLAKVHATQEVYQELQHVYDYYNQKLFNNELPGALLVMTRKRGSKGFFSPARYANKEGALADEISMNPEYFLVRSVEEVLSTLAHEMCHQWQFNFGKDVRAGYHNKEFSTKMEEIGLITSATGYPGGDRVGEKMTHYIAEDGLFITTTRELLKSRFGILWYDRYPSQYLMRPPSKEDIENAENKRAEVEEEHKKALEQQGKTVSNRGRKKQEILKVEPAAVSNPEILIETPLSKVVNTQVVNQEPTSANVSNVVAKLIKRQEAKQKAGKRVKYTCKSCEDSAWGKADMTLICGRDGCNLSKMEIIKASKQDSETYGEPDDDLLN
jgi:predicted SprT family Zn-dependent metalloprotease